MHGNVGDSSNKIEVIVIASVAFDGLLVNGAVMVDYDVSIETGSSIRHRLKILSHGAY